MTLIVVLGAAFISELVIAAAILIMVMKERGIKNSITEKLSRR